MPELFTNEIRNKIKSIALIYGAKNIRVFGSMARGDFNINSDVDLIVDLEPGRSLMDLAGLKLELEAILQRSVDIGTEKGLKPRYKNIILAEAIQL